MSGSEFPFIIDSMMHREKIKELHSSYREALPFKHVVIDDFLPAMHVEFLASHFPPPEHPVWLEWKLRLPNQYGKQGVGDSEKFSLLDPAFRLALNEFNASPFLSFVEGVTGIEKLIPDPYFTGGGIHQILEGGILYIHTDFNIYEKLNLYRQVNVLIYLTDGWLPAYGGQLEFWDRSPWFCGQCVKAIAPLFNRAVIFKTGKASFHGHPLEWSAPAHVTRRSIALYYYISEKMEGCAYSDKVDFTGVSVKPLPCQPVG